MGWDGSGQLVGCLPAEPVSWLSLRALETREVAELRRNSPVQSVEAERQNPQVGEVAELRRDRPRELVFIELQDTKTREGGELRRNGPGQLILVKI